MDQAKSSIFCTVLVLSPTSGKCLWLVYTTTMSIFLMLLKVHYRHHPLLVTTPYVFGRLKKARESAIPSLGRVKGGVSAPCFYA
jgi:hypothetical protein